MQPKITTADIARRTYRNTNHGVDVGDDCYREREQVIGADFRSEVPGQSSVGLIGGGRGQWLGAPWRVRSTSL